MDNSAPKFNVGIVLMLGSVWGLSEAGLGMALKACASMASGSVMTGVALFFIAASWVITRRISGVVLLIMVACSFKLFDAVLLSLPLKHGAIANPIFAIITQGFVFILFVFLFRNIFKKERQNQIATGGASTALAAGSFPLVKFATGIPACVYAGTAIPLSVLFAPLAIVLSCLTVPLGFHAGLKLNIFASQNETGKYSTGLLSPATLVLCLVLIAFIRLA